MRARAQVQSRREGFASKEFGDGDRSVACLTLHCAWAQSVRAHCIGTCHPCHCQLAQTYGMQCADDVRSDRTHTASTWATAWAHYTVRAGSGCLAATDDLIVFVRTVPMPALVSLALEACDDVSDAELLPLLRKVHSTQRTRGMRGTS